MRKAGEELFFRVLLVWTSGYFVLGAEFHLLLDSLCAFTEDTGKTQIMYP
jgi:hypothetical protein